MRPRSIIATVALLWAVLLASTAARVPGIDGDRRAAERSDPAALRATAGAPANQSPAANQAPGGGAAAPAAEPRAHAGQLLAKYCTACHNDRLRTGGLAIDALDLEEMGRDAAAWEKVVRRLRTGAMPPAGMPRPTPAEYDTLASWLEATLDASPGDPGRPALHRLNRAEYANVIRDLLGLEVDVEAFLPPDDSISGFDNIADGLGTSPVLLERYLAAAAEIAALAVGSPEIGASSRTYRVRGDASQTQHVDGLPLGTRGGVLAQHVFPLDGEYVIQVKLLETNLGSLRGLQHEHELDIFVDGQPVHRARVGGEDDYTAAPDNTTKVVMAVTERLQARVFVRAGPRPVGAAFVQRSHAQGGDRLQPFLRSTVSATDHLGVPHVESLTILGPFEAEGPGETPSRARVFSCRPATAGDEADCARTIITDLVRRAYRRPGTADEIERLYGLYEVGRRARDFEGGIELALRAVLANPKFLFRSEPEPAGVAPGTPFAIGDLELASRLSFFLWSSIPDEELIDLAVAGRLREPAVLEAQIARMLADPRSRSLVTNFAGQWLYLRNLRNAQPDPNAFPHFDDNLRRAFQTEAELFVDSIVREDRSVLDLLTADHTFLNERLARHYGIPNVYGSHFRRVTLEDARRHGLLGKGAVLLVTSHADRTSPVVRGQWILANLLGTPPPPPPPDVDTSLADSGPGGTPQTLRARLEAHRANPQCASCHRAMDPLGFALEHFDAVGAWRTEDAGSPIDASGEFVDGTRIDGVVKLREALTARPDVFVTTMAEKLLTYALGRRVEPADMHVVRAIVRGAAAEDYRFSSMVRGIVHSQPFQMRTAAPEGGVRVAAR